MVVGAGQAGLALSHHLSRAGHDHVLLERGRVGQRWHERWDSLTLLSANWMNLLPGVAAPGDPDGFLSRTDVIAHLEAYARSFGAPVVEGVDVTRIERRGASLPGRDHEWHVARAQRRASRPATPPIPYVPFAAPREVAVAALRATTAGPTCSRTGPFSSSAPARRGSSSHSSCRLPGATSSSRSVVIRALRVGTAAATSSTGSSCSATSTGRSTSCPTSRRRSACRCSRLSGANGGEDLGLDRLAALGVTVTGRLERFDGRRAVFADDLAENVAAADARLGKVLRRIDAHPLARRTDEAHPEPLVLPAGPRSLDLERIRRRRVGDGVPSLRTRGCTSTGRSTRRGEIVHRHGATRVPGLYVLGLAYQSRRSSHFIGGVGRDAESIAGRIAASPAGGARVGWRRIAAAALGALLLLPAASDAAAKRPRPTDVPFAETTTAPNGYQVYNDYASPELTYPSERVVVHYVALGIDAPPLNDDDGDGVPDYVQLVGRAADRALAYYERRGFRAPLPDEDGPDARPDLYVTRFMPGTLGIAFPSAEAAGGPFAVVSNNLDPSAERSFGSVHATVAHELFHLVQFSYFPADGTAALPPPWILEGTAAALETRVAPELDDLVSTLQLRHWFAATGRSIVSQSYGAQLLWRSLDAQQPRFLPALFARLAAAPAAGDGRDVVAATYARTAGRPFAQAFHRFAVSVAGDHGDVIEPAFRLGAVATRTAVVAPLAVHYVRPVLPRAGGYALTVTFPHGGSASATLTYELASEVAGGWPSLRRVAGRTSDHGRTTTFAVPAALRADPRLANPLLVVSNGGARAVRYAVNAR